MTYSDIFLLSLSHDFMESYQQYEVQSTTDNCNRVHISVSGLTALTSWKSASHNQKDLKALF
jgi:hypothetical protein